MSDFDKLELENVDEERVVSVVEPKVQEEAKPKKKVDIFAVIGATIKRDKAFFDSFDEEGKRLPDLSYTILASLSFLALAILLLVMNFVFGNEKFVNGYKLLIPVMTVILCVALPTLIIVFFYELNAERNVKIFTLFLAFLIGFSIYFVLNFFASFIYQFVAKEQIEQIGFPIIFTLLCFFSTILLSSAYKSEGIGDCFLIAVVITMGYYVTSELVASFTKIFVVDGNIVTGTYTAPPGAGVIINTGEYLKNNYEKLFGNWLFDYLLLPHMYACWAALIGFVASFAGESRHKKREVPKSVYLLLMLVMLLNIIAVLDTAIDYLSVILKVVALIASTIINVSFINIYLQSK